MAGDSQAQKYNDDLLLEPRDQEKARAAFPALFHVLDDAELRTLFASYNTPADRAKQRSLRLGTLSVLLVVSALFVTSAGHLYERQSWAWVLAAAAAVAGLVGVGIGFAGLMWGRAKQEWLRQRLAGELLRQFHFQVFVCRLPDILASLEGEAARDAYRTARRNWLSEFEVRFPPHLESELQALLHRETGIWLHPAPQAADESVLAALPHEFFGAYEALRLRHQLQYAEWNLRGGELIASGLTLRAQEAILAVGSVAATLCLVGIESLIITPLTVFELGFAPWAHWLAVCFAVVALGLRTLEEGLQPKREIERYERYSDNVQDILERFSAGSRAVKLNAMIEMERLTFEEMRDFLRSRNESRFVM